MKVLITNYISQIEEIQNGQPWVGNSYRDILRNINDSNGFIQPFKEMHSIAEILSHCTMWRYDYNFYHPHKTLDYKAPCQFASRYSNDLDPWKEEQNEKFVKFRPV